VRVLYLCESYLPHIGGVETVSDALARALQARGHIVEIVTNQRHPTDLPEETVHGVPVRRFPMSWALGERRLDVVASLVRELAALKQAFSPDVVHVAYSGPMGFFHLRSGAGAPTLVTLHVHLAPGPLAVQLRAHARRIVAVSPALGESDVLLNGYPDPPAPLVDAPEAPIVLALGRLVAEKGFDLLIAAWPLVRARVPGARLVIAGDGPERPRLAAEGVELIGWIPPAEVYRAVDAARIVAIPSRWEEPFGLVALDAAWRARPVVAARRGGLSTIVEDGRTGLLVDPEAREPFADAIVSLLSNRARARDMGRAARERACAHYSVDRMTTDYERAYAELL
jgi:glycogen(starch) synthase